jgi:hypothetical protein
MKITFDDGSFLELSKNDDGTVTIIVCGFKNKKQLVMSSSKLEKKDLEQLFEFIKVLV